MVFETLDPFRAEILQLRAPGSTQLSYAQIADHLRQRFGLRTTPGTLCRYVKEIAPDRAGRSPDKAETAGIDTLILFAELLAEVKGRGDEQRRAIEAQAGEIRVLAEAIAEIKRASAEMPPSSDQLRAIWLRAFGFSILAVLCITTLLLVLVRP